ncbi:MmcQ/YjbR family DNA-binding protein [Cellulosimicrobium sp. CUA-896]|uniref:MmcQ/YjbR family DNA-binding protein n=1 Tax=Cellulosimicrobium sp. CUA-896 TaxID=1517881 RepID=UPI00095CBE2B|nr:MmcQ/YjbR family DNA-binding protein [Cellulosimicrobium sp. CUA-896]OLT55327.1 hypothetical protein BJF88_06775 [Cellulosimicrobium sp. CUA-896]
MSGPSTRPGGAATASQGRSLFAELSEPFLERPGVTAGTMFHSPGLRTGGKFFAFVDTEDGLVVKVPRDRAVELVRAGTADVVTLGRRTLREWVTLPCPAPGPADAWRDALEEAYDYVASL